MNFLEKTGLLSGFDPQNKLTSLSYVLRTLMASYARVNNRIVLDSDTIKFFSTNNMNTIRFLLPSNATNVMLWTIGYKPINHNSLSDCLAMELKGRRVSSVLSSLTTNDLRLYRETSESESSNSSSVYRISLEVNDGRRVEGNYHFFIVCYEIDNVIHNGYVSNFQEDIETQDKANYLNVLSEYVKYLTSGNKNYGQFFTTYKRNTEAKSLVVKEQVKNRTTLTPFLSEERTNRNDTSIDTIILPIVNLIESKDRRGNVSVRYEIAYASDLNEQCHLLFSYVKAIHHSSLLNLPMTIVEDTSSSLMIRNEESVPLIGLFTYKASSGRHSDRIVIRDSNIARLLFGTDGQWLISRVGQDTKFKSPGNGALLQVLLGECSEEANITRICGTLAGDTEGIYNDLLGKSTIELEDSMIEDANITRSLSDVSFTYSHLTGIDTTEAYKVNYTELFRLLARLRSGGSDYFVSILQPQMKYAGKRQRHDITDSTKLMSYFNKKEFQRVFKGADGTATAVSRVEGGMFFTLKRNDEDRTSLCPFGSEMKEINEIYSLYGTNNTLFTPLSLNGTQLVSLNQHQPITIRFLSDGTLLPQQAKPFKSNPQQIDKLNDFHAKTIDYMLCQSFIDKLETYIERPSEYKFACKLAKHLSQGRSVSIYDLLNEPEKAIIIQMRRSLDKTFAEERVPRIFTNIVTNSPTNKQQVREHILDEYNMVALMTREIVEDVFEEYSPLDKINGFLLCCDWKKPSFYKYLALNASVMYAKNKITSIISEEREPPFTEAIWPNFGIVPHIELSNGDVMIRTLNGSLSQRSNAIQMILASKHWTFVTGSLPKNEHSINTTRQFFEIRDYTRDRSIAMASFAAVASPTFSTTLTRSLNSIQRQITFIDMFRIITSGVNPLTFKLKPEQRKVIMMIICKEWESLSTWPLSRRSDNNNNNKHVSFKEFHKVIQIGLPSSFKIDGKPYQTEQYRTRAIEEYVDSL